MMEIQILFSKWLTQVASYLPFGYSFGAGMVSAVNPCGFAMLPVYLTLYLGAEDGRFHDQSVVRRVFKALGVTLVVTSGFGLLFGVAGAVIVLGGTFLHRMIPWLSLIVGACLFVLGIWLLLGHYVSAPALLRLSEKFGDPRRMTVWGFFLFGATFGATSMSCTLPIFLLVMGSSIASGDVGIGFLQFVSYISGTGSVLLVLTMGIALVKQGVVVGALRRVLPYVQKISAVLLLVAGVYIVYYWMTSEIF
jgi:cytochrome c biogenesis protein CcdA